MPLNATFNPANRNIQRVLNYSAIFDEIEDFEINVRNVSGPGNLAAALTVQPAPPPATACLDPNHGLLIGDNGDINLAPCVVNPFNKANAERPQHTVTLPGSNRAIPRDDRAARVGAPGGPHAARAVHAQGRRATACRAGR